MSEIYGSKPTFDPILERAIDHVLASYEAIPPVDPEEHRTVMTASFFALKEMRAGLAHRRFDRIEALHYVARFLICEAELRREE